MNRNTAAYRRLREFLNFLRDCTYLRAETEEVRIAHWLWANKMPDVEVRLFCDYCVTDVKAEKPPRGYREYSLAEMREKRMAARAAKDWLDDE